MPIGATIGAAVIGGGASLLAASKQEKAANKATDTQLKMYNQTRKDLTPFAETGRSAVYSLADLYGLDRGGSGPTGAAFNPEALETFRRSPDYQFAFDEGNKALQASQAAKGRLVSGGAMKELVDFGQGLASQQFGRYVDQLARLAGIGGSAAAGQGQAAMSTGRGMADTITGGANAGAAGIVGAANSVNSGVQNYLKNFSSYAPPPAINWNTYNNNALSSGLY